MPARATSLMLIALAGCEQQPSKLDELPDELDVHRADWQAWLAIEQRALPMSMRHDLLEKAVGIPNEGSVAERAAALVEWMDAGGSFPVATTTTLGSPAFEFYPGRLIELVEARPDDDRLFEAALYTAGKLRRDGTGYLAAALANMITSRLAELRPMPPQLAAKYAPTDAEVFRLIASEAMYARHATFEIEGPLERRRSAELALWREFANAPRERGAFLAFVDKTVAAHPKSVLGTMIREYAERMFDAVDRYQTWLRDRSGPTSGP
jgi:hypothetical protein